MKRVIAAALVFVAGGCAASGGSGGSGRGVAMVASGDPAPAEAALGVLRGLKGEWEMVDEKGQRQPGVVFAPTAAGHVVREIMFPGQAHEMTNAYHCDGGTLVMTHYCAVGNQPRMRAQPPRDGRTFEFRFDSVTNLHAPDGTSMGSMTLVLVDPDTIREEWGHFQGGKPGAPTVFTLKRKQP